MGPSLSVNRIASVGFGWHVLTTPSPPPRRHERQYTIPQIGRERRTTNITAITVEDLRRTGNPKHSLNTNSVALLDTPLFEYVGDSTSLPQQFGVRNLSGFRSFIGLVDDGSFVRVGIEMTIKTIVTSIDPSLWTIVLFMN